MTNQESADLLKMVGMQVLPAPPVNGVSSAFFPLYAIVGLEFYIGLSS